MSELYPAAEQPLTLPGQNCLIVQLAAGQLVLIGDFNYFRIDGADRQLIETILNAIDTHTEMNLPVHIPDFPEPASGVGPFMPGPLPEPPRPSAPSFTDEQLAKMYDLTLDQYRNWTDAGRPPVTQWRTANVEPKPEEPTPEAN